MKKYPYTGGSFNSLGSCCSVSFTPVSAYRQALYRKNFNDPVVYEPEEKTRERVLPIIYRILSRAEQQPVVFTTRSDTEALFEKMLEEEWGEYFTRCTQTPTAHGYPETHLVSVWVCHRHEPNREEAPTQAPAEAGVIA